MDDRLNFLEKRKIEMRKIKLSSVFGVWMIITLLFFVNACTEDNETGPVINPDPTENLTLLAQTSNGIYTVKLFGENPAKTSYNEISVQILSSTGEPVPAQRIQMTPMMDMGEMEHSCPHTELMRTDDEFLLYSGEINFIMPSSEMAIWYVDLDITPRDNPDEAFEVRLENIEVVDSPWLKRFTYEIDSTTSVSYFVALKGLTDPTLGRNDIELWISYKENMMSFPDVTDLILDMEPWMPSMGHGSTGNEIPSHANDGRYSGVVVFNMTGDWQITFTFTDADQIEIGEVVYEFDF